MPLCYPENTIYQPTHGTRCCDNCQPNLFIVEVVKLVNPPGLKRGKKKETIEEDKKYIRNKLLHWRDNVLLEQYYGGLTSISAGTLMSDEVIEKIVGCGERPRNYAEFEVVAKRLEILSSRWTRMRFAVEWCHILFLNFSDNISKCKNRYRYHRKP